jgi:hypothetical protein
MHLFAILAEINATARLAKLFVRYQRVNNVYIFNDKRAEDHPVPADP